MTPFLCWTLDGRIIYKFMCYLYNNNWHSGYNFSSRDVEEVERTDCEIRVTNQ